VLSGSLPPGAPDDVYARMIRCAKDGARVVVDTSGGALQRTLDARPFLVKPNLRELSQLAGHPLESDEQIEEAAQGLVREGKVAVVVVSLGAGGAVVVSEEGARTVRAPTVPIRSKVGAGDSTVAGITLALSRGESLVDAARFGVAAGAAAVMTEGTELCRREDTERLYGCMKRRGY
jgi:6-phosphofructokinase 2